MKKINNIIVTFLSLLVITACGSGYRYLGSDPLSFSELDYGYKVQKLGQNPSIAYIDVGNKNADKTLVLIHGLASNLGFFKEIIPFLESNYRIVAVDLPGYGHSEKGDFPYGMKWYAEQVQNLIKELDLKKVYLSGHSMGGQIAITYALNHPQELEELILLSPAGVEPFRQGEGEWLSSVITIKGTMLTTEEQARINLARNFYEWDDRYEWMVEERMRLAKSKDEFVEFAYAVDQCVDAMLNEPTTERLNEISIPVTIIHGKYDGLIPNPYLHPGFTADVFEKGVQAMQNAKRIEIDKAGHMLMIEQPQKTAEAIKSALN